MRNFLIFIYLFIPRQTLSCIPNVGCTIKKQDNTEKGNWGKAPEIKGSLEQFRVSEKSDMSDVASIYVL